MTERASGGNELSEQQKELTKTEDDSAYEEVDKREKVRGQGTDAVAVVKSKIREKNAAQDQSEEKENYATLKTSKVMTSQSTQSKIYKLGKHKRNKNKSSELTENQESVPEDTKSENSDPEILQTESLYTDSKITLGANSALSKKSLMQTKSMARDSKKLIGTDEHEKSESTHSETNLADETQSTFVISHDAEPQKEQNQVAPIQTQQAVSTRSASQRQIVEKGNYLSNVSPLPIDEYPADDKSEEIKK